MSAMEKLDLEKTYPEYFKARKAPQVINLEPLNYVTANGVSAPENELFTSSIERLYGLIYTMKFASKANGLDFKIPKMEAFWWAEGDTPLDKCPREKWHWKIMFRLPDFLGIEEYKSAVEALKNKHKLSEDHNLACEEIHEGRSAQLLHIGSYDEEGPSLEKLFSFIEKEGLSVCGRHHEIYLNDPRKVPVERLRTILRYAIC